MPTGRARDNVAAATFIFAGLVLDTAMIQHILREDSVKKTVTYQYILEQGLQRGLAQGLEQGLERGAQVEAVALVLRLLRPRFGFVEERVAGQVRSRSLPQPEPADVNNRLEQHG